MTKYNLRVYVEDDDGETYLGTIELVNSLGSRELALRVQTMINNNENPAGRFIRA